MYYDGVERERVRGGRERETKEGRKIESKPGGKGGQRVRMQEGEKEQEIE